MTILNNGTRNQYTATSGQSVFNYNFEIFEAGDIVVYVGTVLQSGYTVTGVGTNSGGTITLPTGLTAGQVVTIFRETAPERLADYQNSGEFLAEEVDNDMDRLWAVIQELRSNQNRFLQTAQTTQVSLPVTLEDSITGNLLRWKDPNTIDSVPASNVTPGGEITTDYARNITNYAALRLIDTSLFADGQAINITDDGIAGVFVLRNSAGHGLTDNGETLIVIDSNWYAESIDPYKFVPADTSGLLGGKYNVKMSNPFAQIAGDVHTCWIGYGGHESFSNVIGSVTGNGANYSGVMGYDNTTDALATAMWHFHGTIATAADHPTMIGGSFCQIQGGSYCATLGGTQNNIVGGDYTAILGGRNNTINPASGAAIVGGNGNINGGSHSSVGGGLTNLIGNSGDQTVIAGGGQNTATQAGTVISGGLGNTVSAQYANITGGRNNEALGSYSRGGGRESVTQYGCDVWASGGFGGVAGSAQIFDFVTRTETSDATESDQYLDGAAIKLTVPENSAWAIKTQCVASDGTDRAVFEFDSLIFRDAGSTASSPTQSDLVRVIHATAGAATWSHRVTVSAGGGVNIKATGQAGKNIKWVTRCKSTQLLD